MLKRLAENLAYRFLAADAEDLARRIKDCSVVSFDVFDTLVKRDAAAPADVFVCMEHRLCERSQAIENFAALRMEAGLAARRAHPEREITLEEIYARMPVEPALARELMELECRMEEDLSTVHIPLKQVYDACVAQGKTVLFISDMYLPEETVGRILRKNGYTEGKLFVSSAFGVTKRSGELFGRIQSAESLDTRSWVHIGDSVMSDYLVPRRLGIGSRLVRR